MSKEMTVQNCADFVPSSKMRRWFEAAFETRSFSPATISAYCGIHRNTFYYWQTIPGFMEWWEEEMKIVEQSMKMHLLDIGLKAARRGSYKHWRSLMEFFGFLPHSKLTEVK